MIHADAARPNRGSIYGAAASAGDSADFGRYGRAERTGCVDRSRRCRWQRAQYELPSPLSP
ncbi:hypothetical protein C5C07_18435 [Haloferax sp. Atlit-4N]|uniref:Uncharacterized protein n=1 Tax=Haloferax gibbonsii TaxID=35746 RepID=A0A871BL09_HALGI|nr:uncharacterized protein HfgLR_23055 [Haloferax gibbonsii]RDZ50795.1 hypothetical protein C5C07_18435 [Haloferax sp. Atlit-4N]